ncbi:hypothetical protein ACIQXF_19425 [Lysinibacillus sp. NPDC097231]
MAYRNLTERECWLLEGEFDLMLIAFPTNVLAGNSIVVPDLEAIFEVKVN